MNFKIEIIETKHDTRVEGYANSLNSCFEQISLFVTKDNIKCGSSSAIPTNHVEEYIELYHQVLHKAKEVQNEMSKDKKD